MGSWVDGRWAMESSWPLSSKTINSALFKPSQIYFLMLFFCNFPHSPLFFTLRALYGRSSFLLQPEFLGIGIGSGYFRLSLDSLLFSTIISVFCFRFLFVSPSCVGPTERCICVSTSVPDTFSAVVARELSACLLCPSNYALSQWRRGSRQKIALR